VNVCFVAEANRPLSLTASQSFSLTGALDEMIPNLVSIGKVEKGTLPSKSFPRLEDNIKSNQLGF